MRNRGKLNTSKIDIFSFKDELGKKNLKNLLTILKYPTQNNFDHYYALASGHAAPHLQPQAVLPDVTQDVTTAVSSLLTSRRPHDSYELCHLDYCKAILLQSITMRLQSRFCKNLQLRHFPI